jgi:DNA polymerase kappa
MAATLTEPRRDRARCQITTPSILGPVCPLCSKALGPGTSNSELNQHIDMCLNRDALGAGSMSPKPKRPSSSGTDHRPDGSKRRRQAQQPKTAAGSMMNNWLKRAN